MRENIEKSFNDQEEEGKLLALSGLLFLTAGIVLQVDGGQAVRGEEGTENEEEREEAEL